MATWDRADLLYRLKKIVDAPTLDETMDDDADWYPLLSSGQRKVYRIFAQHCPHVITEAPQTMTSSDGGSTYPFPNGDYALTAELRSGRGGPVLLAGADFSGFGDYVLEGNKIRIPNGSTRTFSNGLYVRYVKMPPDITSSVDPTLTPDYARELIPYAAAEEWASFGSYRDPSAYARQFSVKAFGDPMVPGDTGIIGSLKSQVFGGAFGADSGMNSTPYLWWRSGDLRHA